MSKGRYRRPHERIANIIKVVIYNCNKKITQIY